MIRSRRASTTRTAPAKTIDTFAVSIARVGLLRCHRRAKSGDADGLGMARWSLDPKAVDLPGELQAPPRYPQRLQAIRIKIRVLVPDSKQIREVTVVQNFGLVQTWVTVPRPNSVGNALRGVPCPAERHGVRSLQGNRRLLPNGG